MQAGTHPHPRRKMRKQLARFVARSAEPDLLPARPLQLFVREHTPLYPNDRSYLPLEICCGLRAICRLTPLLSKPR